jgi:hypothetical protein
VAVLAAVTLLVSGCSGGDSAARPSGSRGRATSTQGPGTPATTPAATDPSAASADPTPGSMETPATTSGPLSKRSFPRPRTLGPHWRYAVDPGDVEEGYAGNGTPSLRRSPAEIVQTAVPIGCERSAELPAPRNALEVDYTVRGHKAVAVRSRFADAPTARRFFQRRGHDLRACAGVVGSAAIGLVVARVDAPAPGVLVNDRTPTSDPWREVAVLDRDTVLLLAVRGVHALSTAETRHLVQEARR